MRKSVAASAEGFEKWWGNYCEKERILGKHRRQVEHDARAAYAAGAGLSPEVWEVIERAGQLSESARLLALHRDGEPTDTPGITIPGSEICGCGEDEEDCPFGNGEALEINRLALSAALAKLPEADHE